MVVKSLTLLCSTQPTKPTSIATQLGDVKHTSIQSDSVVHPKNTPFLAAVFSLRVHVLQTEYSDNDISF